MKITIVGLGYVGAPLAYELSKHFDVIGFDINETRVSELSQGIDRTNELSPQDLARTKMVVTTDASCLDNADILIVTVPTPVDSSHVPDLSPVLSATRAIGRRMKKGATVVYESTVYPGVTEELCVPLLEELSGLKHLVDFNVGYSPERINPGDKVHTLTTTTKIVSGDTLATRDTLSAVYGKVTKVYLAESIKVAEAAKVIENTQRDVNIALMNELSQLFSRLGVDTADVLSAARSKWNFLDFRPGLVGGHCISVDPYYLTHKAATHGFTASLILSAREINDGMANFVTDQLLRQMTLNHLLGKDTVVTILGTTFKEDVPDIRNSKIADIYHQLKGLGLKVQVVDPMASSDEVFHEYGYPLTRPGEAQRADAVILAVAHKQFREAGWELVEAYGKEGQTIICQDLKSSLDRNCVPAHVVLWRP